MKLYWRRWRRRSLRSLLLMPRGGSTTAATRSRFSIYECRCKGSSERTARKTFISTGNISSPTRQLSSDRIHSTSFFGLCPEVLRVYGCLLLRAGVPKRLASEQAQQCLLCLYGERQVIVVLSCAGKVDCHGLLLYGYLRLGRSRTKPPSTRGLL